jgi:type IX secretion system PorP/SprF family membrane protein
MKHLTLIIIIASLSGIARAQDIHFSQFYETSVLRNPALTGIFSEDYKVTAAYRSQWNTLGNPFRTMALSAEGRFAINRDATDYLTVSIMGYTDNAGRAALKTTGFYPAINYNKSLSDPHNSYLSVGFAAGYLQRSFEVSKLTFNNQYQGGTFVAAAGAGEAIPIEKLSHFDLGAGVSFNSGLGENNNIVYFIGLSAYHFTQPRSTFAENTEVMNLATRWNGSLGVHCVFNDVWSFQFHGNYAQQGAYREIMGGALLRWGRVNESNRHVFSLSAGCFYRMADAIVPTLKIEYKQQTFGISYDVNVSKLKAVTGMRGGLEVTTSFNGFFSPNYDDKRLCPRF